jgi:nicotinamidase-related amidase
MDTIIIVDMQVGLLKGDPKHDLEGVIARINALTSMVRSHGGKAIWIRHCGTDDDFAPQRPGWEFLPELARDPADIIVPKTLNDAFAGTSLQATLHGIGADRVLVAGWATDFCVDATVRSAVSHDHHVVVVADGHTLADRPHLAAPDVIRHHNWVWSNLITRRSVRVMPTAALAAEISAQRVPGA